MFKSTTASKKLRAQDSSVAKKQFIETVVTRSRKVQESTKASSLTASSADNLIMPPERIASGYGLGSKPSTQVLASAAPSLSDPFLGGNPDNGSLITSQEYLGVGEPEPQVVKISANQEVPGTRYPKSQTPSRQRKVEDLFQTDTSNSSKQGEWCSGISDDGCLLSIRKTIDSQHELSSSHYMAR